MYPSSVSGVIDGTEREKRESILFDSRLTRDRDLIHREHGQVLFKRRWLKIDRNIRENPAAKRRTIRGECRKSKKWN